MCAVPVELVAAAASPELPSTLPAARWDVRPCLFAFDPDERPVATRAAHERTQTAHQVETPDDLEELLPRMGRAQPIPVRDGSPFQEFPVPRQNDPSLTL